MSRGGDEARMNQSVHACVSVTVGECADMRDIDQSRLVFMYGSLMSACH